MSTPAVVNETQFRALMKSKQGKQTITAFAKSCKVSPQFMSKVLDGTWHPGDKIAKALGFEQVVAFRRISPKKAKAKPKAKAKAPKAEGATAATAA